MWGTDGFGGGYIQGRSKEVGWSSQESFSGQGDIGLLARECPSRGNLEIELIYYPPYHSKYNPVERCWGILEMHWNGTLLDTVEKALGWAKTMTWKGTQPVVQLLERVYPTGVRLTQAALKPFAERVGRSKTLSRWSASIHPEPTHPVPLCSPP